MIDVVHNCVAMKPVEGNFAQNAVKHGVAGLNVEECRIETDGRPLIELDAKQTNNNAYAGRMDGSLAGGSKAVGTTTQGRWPANVILDDSDEVKEVFPYGKSVANIESDNRVVIKAGNSLQLGKSGIHNPQNSYGDEGSAARFFKQCESDND